MIKVIIGYDSNRDIVAIEMSGHAGYATSGKDIVCAGASTLFYTMANSLERICGFSTDTTTVILENSGTDYVSGSVRLPDCSNKDVWNRAQVIMTTMVTGFMILASSVNDGDKRYIEVTELD